MRTSAIRWPLPLLTFLSRKSRLKGCKQLAPLKRTRTHSYTKHLRKGTEEDSVFCEIYPTNYLGVYADSGYFFTGDAQKDRLRAEMIVDLALLGIESFGPAYACFSGEITVDDEVKGLQKKGGKPNFCGPEDREDWVDRILNRCEEIRLAG